jgi:hypothetical protein
MRYRERFHVVASHPRPGISPRRALPAVLAVVLLAAALLAGAAAFGALPAGPDLHGLTMAAKAARTGLSGQDALLAAYEVDVIALTDDCVPHRSEVDFGELTAGSRATHINSVTNYSSETIVIDPSCSDPAIRLDVSATEVPPGEHAFIIIHYEPLYWGVLDAIVSVGSELCQDIHVMGSAGSYVPEASDRLGIYFDEGHSATNVYADLDAPLVEGYLVMAGPSTSGGLTAWECRLEIDGIASVVSSRLAGAALNVGHFPDFVVGLAEPLPYLDEVVMAEIDFFSPGGSESRIVLGPVSEGIQSVAGQMSWISGRDVEILLNMVPAGGDSVVATINGPGGSCELYKYEHDFGAIAVGSRAHVANWAWNHTESEIVIDPRCDDPAVAVQASRTVLGPGEKALLDIFYEPSMSGILSSHVDLGSQFCEDIILSGSATPAHPDGSDQIGVYWDDEYLENDLVFDSPAPVAFGHLVLRNASTDGGVAAWECRVEVEGSGALSGADIPYPAMSLLSAPDFAVIANEPQPYQEHVVLATLYFLVPDPFGVTLISLVPPRINVLVDGQMSWVSGRDADLHLDMRSATGQAVVASINGDAPVALEFPTPLAQAAGRQLELSWAAYGGDLEGYHVYGRAPGQSAERLTDSPLAAVGGEVRFSDDLGRWEGGATVFYSYAGVKAGVEMGRSPEVEVLVPSLPLLSTQLLPNVPNPFNPRTEIRFEMPRAGRADVRIYDLTGRLVRTLVAGDRPAGLNAEMWEGHDDAGRPVSSGAYYVQLVTDDGADNRKIMLLK